MKYWRGYLTAAICAAFAWALSQFAAGHTVLVDMVYPYVTRTLQSMLAQWSSSVDFCVWQVFAVALIVIALALIVLMIVFKWNPVQLVGWILAGASVVYLLHTLVFGLNYYAGPLADDVRLEVTEYTITELADATAYYRDLANELAGQVSRDSSGNVEFDSFEDLAQQAAQGFETLTYEDTYAVFAGSTLPVKKLGWSEMYTSMGITGMTVGLTGEAAVNPLIPDVSLPFTMCHEMAHRMSIATESDANFAAFLACSANESVEFRYSAYFMAYRYCYNALASVNTNSSAAAAARVSAEASELLKRDISAYNQFFAEKKSNTATKVADVANDTYLKASGDELGTASYGAVCDLLVSWHIQEVVGAQQELLEQEQENKFDPYDETQVDLSGIVNAVTP